MNPTRSDLTASIVITTKNRKEDLRVALASALEQRSVKEILVIDDGSTDGTADLVRAEFPTVRLERFHVSSGYIVQRNRGARLATGSVIVSMDDDAAFTSPHTVEQTLADFGDPRIAAVAIPFVNVKYGPEVHQRAPTAELTYICDRFIGTAHALRRDVFLAVGGYREVLFHQGEESDLCLRMLDRGYLVRLGNAAPIHHFESPNRDRTRMDVYGKRNLILFAWQNVPMPHLGLHLLGSTLKGTMHGIRNHTLPNTLRGLAMGFRDVSRGLAGRKPISRASYRLMRELKRRGQIPLSEIEATLPSLRSDHQEET